jgi:hypothetical protein
MTYTVVWLPDAMSAFRRLRADRDGAKQVSAAVAGLATDAGWRAAPTCREIAPAVDLRASDGGYSAQAFGSSKWPGVLGNAVPVPCALLSDW